MMESKKKNYSVNKTMLFQMVVIIFATLFFTFAFMIIFVALFYYLGDWQIEAPDGYRRPFSPMNTIFVILGISIIIGTILSIYFGNRFLKPIKELKALTGEVAKGKFDIEVTDIPENEVGELIENFNIMVKELKKNEMLKEDFISNVSHEFKTPLSTIQGYSTLLQDDNLTDEDKNKYISIIFQATEKLTTLVNGILKISKIDNRKITIEKINYSLDEQIRESILSLEYMWNKKNIDLNIELENIMITADKNLLSNVWNNLISNAIKYSKNNGKIDIYLCLEDDLAKCTIKDYGCGIKEEDIPYIFDKFYQADKSHNSDGNGLGLALVKKIIELSKGKIVVNSKISEGSEFIVYLPIK